MTAISEPDNFALDRWAITGPIDFFSNVSIEMKVVDNYFGHVVVGESLMTRNLNKNMQRSEKAKSMSSHEVLKYVLFFKKMGHSRPLFSLFSSFLQTVNSK